MKEKAFIHLFKTIGNFYMYDVNTDRILKIPNNVYRYLETDDYTLLQKNDQEYIEILKNCGFLKSNRVEITEHPDTPYLKYYLRTKINRLILQVTQNCNLRCKYCIYSGGYTNRAHNNKKMTWEMAKRSIDYLLTHSKESTHLALGFYGGEPLLEYELVKRCITYIEEKGEGKKLYFNITTNATLLTDEMIQFFEKHSLYLTISLDGPEEIHDRDRRFNCSGKGSYKVVMEKVKLLNDKYPSYYKENVRFNTVLKTNNSFECINQFVSCEDLVKDNSFSSTMVTEDYCKNKEVSSEKDMRRYFEEYEYENFKRLLKRAGIYNGDGISKLLDLNNYSDDTFNDNMRNYNRTELPLKAHHSGPCVPGITSLFVTTEGDLYPCEKISEVSTVANIGNIYKGINIEKAKKILNIEKDMEKQCHNCWAYSHCTMCLVQSEAIDEDDFSKEEILKKCTKIRANVEESFKNYCMYNEMQKNISKNI